MEVSFGERKIQGSKRKKVPHEVDGVKAKGKPHFQRRDVGYREKIKLTPRSNVGVGVLPLTLLDH